MQFDNLMSVSIYYSSITVEENNERIHKTISTVKDVAL